MNGPARSYGFTLGEPPRSQWDGGWKPDPRSVSRLADLAVGTPVAVVKRAPDGSETTRYPTRVVPTDAPRPWIEVEAVWTQRTIDVAGLVFAPGDTLREFFSPVHPFNAFALHSPAGAFKGWYGNVTFPAFLVADGSASDLTLVWHDLYLDIVILSDGSEVLLDDDELAASGLPESDPDLARAIHAARRDLIAIIPSFLVSASQPPDATASRHEAVTTTAPATCCRRTGGRRSVRRRSPRSGSS